MRYLTHMLLHDLAKELKPNRQRRDNFGLDAAACWCCCISSHATPASHIISNVYKASQSTLNLRTNSSSGSSSSGASSYETIELSILPEAAHVHNPHVDGASEWASEVLHSPAWRTHNNLTPPPKAHCRIPNKHNPPPPNPPPPNQIP